jgi:hypothetical protein
MLRICEIVKGPKKFFLQGEAQDFADNGILEQLLVKSTKRATNKTLVISANPN